ncbi:hypothetical protein FM036_29725 [Nostoc sp. HG1]|nr:hypothetical protein [Nostoc sp. HG1]
MERLIVSAMTNNLRVFKINLCSVKFVHESMQGIMGLPDSVETFHRNVSTGIAAKSQERLMKFVDSTRILFR